MSSILAILTLAAFSNPAMAADSPPTYWECRSQYDADKTACDNGNDARYEACMQAATAAFEACISLVKRAKVTTGRTGTTARGLNLETETVDFILVDVDGVRTFLGEVEVDTHGNAELQLGHDPQVQDVLAAGGQIIID